jgi:hypothetical protein
MWIAGKPIDIANTTFTYLENPIKDKNSKKNDLLYIGQLIKKSFGREMTLSGIDNSYNIEGKFEKINRYVKVSLLKKNNYVIVVTTFARIGFYEKLANEIVELHSLLETYNGNIASKKKTTWLPFVSEAYADGFNLLGVLGGANSNTGSLGSGLNYNLTGNFQDLTTSVKGLNTNVANFNTSIDSTNIQLKAGNANWGNTNNQFESANTNWAKTNIEASKANDTALKFANESKGMNTNWAESNKVLANVMDPTHMAKVAFYTAAGAALGGVAVNLAIQGVSEGISFLHELFTGAKKKKLEWEDFEKAMSMWDNQLNDLVKMEQVVDNYLAAFDFFEGKNLGNDYIKQLTIASRDMRFDRDIFMEKFKDSNLDVSCRKIYYDAADELDQKLKEFDKIITFASNNNASSKNQGTGYFCNQLKELQRKILGAETQMQDLRLKILIAENQFYGKQSDLIEKRDENIEKVNDRLKMTLAEKLEYDKKIMERVKDSHSLAKDEWLTSCYEGKNEQGIAIKEEFANSFAIVAYFKTRSKCSDSFAGIEEALKKRDEDAARRIASEDELRKDLVVKVNTNVEMKLSEEQMSWMSRVHMDAFCYQFAHSEVTKIPKKCNDFPELLYSLSLSKGYEKAKDAYQNKCSEKYLSGLQKIAAQNK